MKNISYTNNDEKQMSYNQWCLKFNVGSMYVKPSKLRHYSKGEYDYDKFIKMIQKYDKQTEKITIWKQISEAFSTLRSR